MDIDVLGGLDVLENGVPVVPAAPPARQVLAVLAGYADQTVPVAVLAEELEAYAPPEHTRAVLHSCVRQLRGRLAAAVDQGGARSAATMLVQTPGGYLLDTGGGRSDLWEFSREAGAGYRAMARGDYGAAARRLRAALGLWRGPAFDGVDQGPRLAELVAGLEATRKSVMEQWVEAELALGRRREPGSARGGAGDTGWGRRRAPEPVGRPFPASGTESDFHRSETAVPNETYRLRQSVLLGPAVAAASSADTERVGADAVAGASATGAGDVRTTAAAPGYAAARAEAAPAEAARAEAARTEAVRADAAEADAVRTEVARTDAGRAEAAEAEAARADAGRAEAAEPGAWRFDAAEADAVPTGAATADSVRTEAAEAGAVRTRAVRAGAWRSGAGPDDSGRGDVAYGPRIGVPPSGGAAVDDAACTGGVRYGDVIAVDFGTRSAARRTSRRRPLSPSVA
ncbi:AfsR/SARP family transcriptional regulator [Streptomyces sp. NPDC055254]